MHGLIRGVLVVSLALCVLALAPTIEPLPSTGPGAALTNGIILLFNILKSFAVAMFPEVLWVAAISGAGLVFLSRYGGGGVF